MEIKDLFRNVEYPIQLYDGNGNIIYFENSDGYWEKWEHDSNGNLIYSEDSNGKIIGNRNPKVKVTMNQIVEKFGIPVSQLKIKKG